MRTCRNEKCVGFGHIVFSVATRCPLCRCDLRRILPRSEVSSKPIEESRADNHGRLDVVHFPISSFHKSA